MLAVNIRGPRDPNRVDVVDAEALAKLPLPLTSKLEIRSNADGHPVSEVYILCTTVAPVIEASVSLLDFGIVAAGQTATLEFEVANTGSDSIQRH